MLREEFEFITLLKNLLEDLVKLLPNAQAGSVLIKKNNKLNFVATVGYDLKKLQKIQFEVKEKELISHDMNANLNTDIKNWNRSYLSKDELETLKKYGKLDSIKANITFPLIGNEGQIIGTFTIDNFDSKEAFNENDVKIAQEFKITAENIIQTKIMVDKLNNEIVTLKNTLKLIYSTYDKYSHNIRNNIQVILFLVDSKGNRLEDLEKEEIKDKISDLETISSNIIHKQEVIIIEKDILQSFEVKANEIVKSLKKQIIPKFCVKLSILNKSVKIAEVKSENYENFKRNNKMLLNITDRFPMLSNYSLKIKLLFNLENFNKFTKVKQIIYPKHIQTIINLEFQRFFLNAVEEKLIKEQLIQNKLIEFFKINIKQFLDYIITKENKININSKYWTNSIVEIRDMINYILKVNSGEYENFSQKWNKK